MNNNTTYDLHICLVFSGRSMCTYTSLSVRGDLLQVWPSVSHPHARESAQRPNEDSDSTTYHLRLRWCAAILLRPTNLFCLLGHSTIVHWVNLVLITC
jgi:hypothetical protein